jgi:energy-coupling factor transporter ATP-binding protein EcfA2
MLPPERRLPELRRLIDEKSYFVLHAPRQTGKTTLLASLAQALQEESHYAVLLTSCEAGQATGTDLEAGIAALLETLSQDAEVSLPPELRPPAADPTVSGATRFRELLIRWSQQCPLPLVLFFDEIDSLRGETLLSVLRQLRSGFRNRPSHFPHAVVLVGLRDVRDYRIRI